MNYEEGSSNGKKTLWIIGGIIVVVMIVALVYGATQRSLKQTSDTPGEDITITPTGGVSDQGLAPAQPRPTSDTPIPENMVALPVQVNSLDVVNLETFPQKVQARVTYGLSGSCAVLDTPVVKQSGKTFTITMTSRALKDVACTKAIVPGEIVIDIPVLGIAAGNYSVKLGTITKSFTLKSDNEIQFTSDK